jgi:hypothetical protein
VQKNIFSKLYIQNVQWHLLFDAEVRKEDRVDILFIIPMDNRPDQGGKRGRIEVKKKLTIDYPYDIKAI